MNTFNLHSMVRVELTSKGKQIIMNYAERCKYLSLTHALNEQEIISLNRTVDQLYDMQDNILTMRLHLFMTLFGQYIDPKNERELFGRDIIIYNKEE